jgi:hypothetical protein
MAIIARKSTFKEAACLQTHRQNVASLPTLSVVSIIVSLFQSITCRTQGFRSSSKDGNRALQTVNGQCISSEQHCCFSMKFGIGLCDLQCLESLTDVTTKSKLIA